MYLVTAILAFAFLVIHFAASLRAAEIHDQGLRVRENPLQRLLWRLTARWKGFLFGVFVAECVLLGIGGWIANGLGAIPGAILFGALLALTILWWPKAI